MWSNLFKLIENAGYEVYPPGTKIGKCDKKYVVVRNDGTTPLNNFSSSIANYSVLLYVPRNEYSTIDDELLNLQNVIKKASPLFRLSGDVTPTFYDDVVEGHMVSIGVINYKRR